MEPYFNTDGVINTLLSVLNVGLEIILGLIALGAVIGLYELIN